MDSKTDTAPQQLTGLRRGVYILPNLLTTASLLCGFLSIVHASEGRLQLAAGLIFASAIFDGLDGKVARLTNTASEFGVQYDSLSDLVAFGAAPAFLIQAAFVNGFGRLGLMAAFLFLGCGALRLARFNLCQASGSKKFFIGLPIPAAGCTLAALVLFAANAQLPAGLERLLPHLALGLTYALALLMVSTVRYHAFKEYGFLKAHKFGAMVTAMVLFAAIASQPKVLAFPLLVGYAAFGLAYTYGVLPRRHSRLLRELS